MKFRKKPIVIEAVQWFPGVEVEGCHLLYTDGQSYARLETLEGEMEVKRADWIIKGVQGEFYPCKPDVFALTYEAVDEA